MRRRALAVACALALAMCGCTVNGVPVDQPVGAEVDPIPSYLLEAYPVEVELDGITFRVPEGGGWEEPDFIDRPTNQSVSVFFKPPGQDESNGNSGTVHLSKPSVNPASFDIPDLGTGLSDAEYINAGIEYFDELEDNMGSVVYDVSDWEVRHDWGGVICTCYYGYYFDPTETHQASSLTAGNRAFVFTDHGSYVFNACYTVSDFADDDPDDTLEVLRVVDTLRVN